jgi:vacuolar-type H+-ATPase subunit I/STV1
MSFASEMMIADVNRNEAREAVETINRLDFENVFDKIKAIEGEFDLKKISGQTLEAIEAVNEIRHELKATINKINAFSEKHQPEIQRWK